MNTDDKFCIQIMSQSVNFTESTSLLSSFRLLQGHRRVRAVPLLRNSPLKSLRRRRGGCPGPAAPVAAPAPHLCCLAGQRSPRDRAHPVQAEVHVSLLAALTSVGHAARPQHCDA